MQLSQLTSIGTGYAFRGKVEHDPNGRYQVIQTSDVDDSGAVRYGDLKHTDKATPKERHVVTEGDVLFIPRGVNNIAVYIDRPLRCTIATSQFYILRPNERLDPAFMAWYLNQETAQAYFDTFARGATIRSINKQILGELTVPVPPIERQRQIAAIDRLARHESALAEALREKRSILIENLLLNATR